MPYNRRFRMQALASAAVLALHIAALWLLWRETTIRAPSNDQLAAAPARITLRLIATVPRPGAPVVATPAPVRSDATLTARRARAAPRTPVGSGSDAAITPPQRDAALPAEAPASATDADRPLLETDASRRAIRASARTPSLGARLGNAREGSHPVGTQQRLANGIESAGKGDCLKGEYAGGGMGLLSLPFLAAAAVSGQCAK